MMLLQRFLESSLSMTKSTQNSTQATCFQHMSWHLLPTVTMVQLELRAIGVQFNWTLNQEIVFSAALTGKPLRKQQFSQYCWERCVIGTKSDYAQALYKAEWHEALRHGD